MSCFSTKNWISVGYGNMDTIKRRKLVTSPVVLFLLLMSINAFSGAVGFGSKATGGAGGKEVTVTTAEQLNAATSSVDPMIITVKGAIVHNVSGGDDNARIWVKSNKTIQGFDSKASVDANFEVVEGDNIIFRNLYISNPEGKGTGDGIEFTKGCTNIWVDHCTFGQCKDGACDVKKGSDFVTISWCKFAYTSATHNHNFANLIGHDDKSGATDRGKLHVTMHHNWYADNVIERMPRVRYGQVHVFNNYYSSKRANYIVGVGVESQILIEASYFDNQGSTTWYNWFDPNKCVEACGPGKIQWTDNNIFAGNTKVSAWATNSTVFKPPYEYTLDKTADIPKIVSAGAGAHPTGIVSINNNSFSQNSADFAKVFLIKSLRSTMTFDLQEASTIKIDLFDNLGKKAATVMNGYRSAGNYCINLNSYGLSKGVYYASVQLNNFSHQHKITNF